MPGSTGYPLYDRSGVEDAGAAIPLARMQANMDTQTRASGDGGQSDARGDESDGSPTTPPLKDIYVCHSGTCLNRGAEATLVEIEELVNAVGAAGIVRVRETGCIGYCSQAPNAVVCKRDSRRIDLFNVHRKIRSLEASAKVVHQATGRRPPLDDASANGRFKTLREARARQHATKESKWNVAFRGWKEVAPYSKGRLNVEFAELLACAGFPNGQGLTGSGNKTMPRDIKNYTQWTLESVTPITKHSAVFRFVSKDRARGTPHPRGRGMLPEPVTFHTTMLAEVGANEEGPLPWIERDYTPISTAKEWEQGLCDILIKIYDDGAATSWLRRLVPGDVKVWLSKPVATMHVPGLTPFGSGIASFMPASVLLILGGTGVVALPQLLAHRDPINKLAMSTPRRKQLHVPIDLILSCREDDTLLLPHITEWCREGMAEDARGIRSCTLLLTPPASGSVALPYPNVRVGDSAEAEALLREVENVRIRRERLSAEVVSDALRRMPHPTRVIVSGPATFNVAARSLLDSLDESQVTLLSA